MFLKSRPCDTETDLVTCAFAAATQLENAFCRDQCKVAVEGFFKLNRFPRFSVLHGRKYLLPKSVIYLSPINDDPGSLLNRR